MKNSFNIEEEERSSSPEKLNECIRIGSAGGLLLIIALAIAAAALIVWGFVGSIPVTITETVAVVGSDTESHMCVGFIDVNKNTGIFPDGTEVHVLMPDGKYVDGVITLMAPQPLSYEEIKSMFGGDEDIYVFFSDWMLEGLVGNSNYSYMYYVETQEDVSAYWHQLAQASIITGEVRPISLLMH